MDNQQPSNSLFYQKPQKGKGFIYMYTSPSGKHYIGQTVNSLARRAESVISGKGYKKCCLFWRAIEKYQFSNFKVTILEEAEIENLNSLEQYYIKKYNSIAPNGYNISSGGTGGKKVEVFVYSAQNGKFLEHYNSVSEASLFTGVPIETISAILNSKNARKIAHNLYFSRDYLENMNLFELARKNYVTVYVYNAQGSFIKAFSSIAEAARELKISEITIRRRCNDGQESCGYYFSRDKVAKIVPKKKADKQGFMVRQIDPITFQTIQVFPSFSAAARAMKLSSASIISSAVKRNGKARGYFWKTIEGSTTTGS